MSKQPFVENMKVIDSPYGWYVSDGGSNYLHKDLTVHDGMWDGKEYNYMGTEKEADDLLIMYLSLYNPDFIDENDFNI